MSSGLPFSSKERSRSSPLSVMWGNHDARNSRTHSNESMAQLLGDKRRCNLMNPRPKKGSGNHFTRECQPDLLTAIPERGKLIRQLEPCPAFLSFHIRIKSAL